MRNYEARDGDFAFLRGRALIISRDPTFSGYYREIFLGVGITPLTADSYEAGLARLRGEVYDLVVVEQGSRMFEGRCILEQVRDSGEDTPVLVVSRRCDTSCHLAALHLGAVNYLEDPVTVPEMVRVISTALRLGSHVA